MNVNTPIVKDVRLTPISNDIVSVYADGYEVYRGTDVEVIQAWTKIAVEATTFQELIIKAAHLDHLRVTFHAVRDERDKLLLKESPLLQCVDCKNTESPAGAMARHFNHGRCMHCGGYFKVVRA